MLDRSSKNYLAIMFVVSVVVLLWNGIADYLGLSDKDITNGTIGFSVLIALVMRCLHHLRR